VKIPTAETANKEAAIKVFILAIDNQKIKTLCWKRRTVNESREVRGRFYRLEEERRRMERRMALLYERKRGENHDGLVQLQKRRGSSGEVISGEGVHALGNFSRQGALFCVVGTKIDSGAEG
jgi:hypothetical protein